jgi:hypothetical protein
MSDENPTDVGRMSTTTVSNMVDNEVTNAFLRMQHYKSPLSSAMMTGDEATYAAL